MAWIHFYPGHRRASGLSQFGEAPLIATNLMVNARVEGWVAKAICKELQTKQQQGEL
jgi:hypothetical protein